MDMLVVSGFLGSGKTTSDIGDDWKVRRRPPKKVVIIVNDFGKIGIGRTVMKKYGLEVQDMPSGCICCTLGSDFLETVSTVATNIVPDLILVEPTGIADPAAIYRYLKMYRGPKVDPVGVFVVVDAVRFPLILKALAIPLKNQLNAADVIIINKIDEAGPEAVQVVKTSLEGLGIRKRTISVSAVTEKTWIRSCRRWWAHDGGGFLGTARPGSM